MSEDDKHNHHYLPKFYLKHWANKQNKVWVYQKHILDGNRFPNPNPLHINNVCSEYHLLSIGDDTSIENWADRNIENHCAPVFKKIVRQEPLNQDDIFYTKSFLALTMSRHPLLKESSKIIYNFISRNVKPLNPLAQTVRLRMEVNLVELNQLSLQILHIPNETDAFFITSDFPAFIVGDLVKEMIGGVTPLKRGETGT